MATKISVIASTFALMDSSFRLSIKWRHGVSMITHPGGPGAISSLAPVGGKLPEWNSLLGPNNNFIFEAFW